MARALEVEVGPEGQVGTEDLSVLLDEVEQQRLPLGVLAQLGALDVEEVGDLRRARGEMRDLVLFLEEVVEFVVGGRHFNYYPPN